MNSVGSWFEARECSTGKGWVAVESGFIFDFLQKIFVCTHEPLIGDFGGRDPSPDVLKQKSKIYRAIQLSLGTLPKEDECSEACQ